MLLARNWPDAELVEIGNQLLSQCDNHEPPFVVVFGPDVECGFSASSMRRDRAQINLATEDESGSRRPAEEILISLAHEVGHLFDPPTPADQGLVKGTPKYHERELEREVTAWSWAFAFLRKKSAWVRLEVVFEHARTRALNRYRALV